MNIKLRSISKLIIVIVVVLAAIWDVYAYLNEENSTFSVIITDWAYYTPLVPFLFGMLMGHWFWPAKGSLD